MQEKGPLTDLLLPSATPHSWVRQSRLRQGGSRVRWPNCLACSAAGSGVGLQARKQSSRRDNAQVVTTCYACSPSNRRPSPTTLSRAKCLACSVISSHTGIMSKEERKAKRQQRLEEYEAHREEQKKAKLARKQHKKEMQAGRKTHPLGMGSGGITEFPDGTIEYRRMMEVLPTFSVNIREVTGFSVRKATKEDMKRFNNARNTEIFTVQGSGTVLGEAPVTYGTAEKIEQWFRAHPDFGQDVKPAANSAPSTTVSLADELTKLAQLKDAGVLTDEEFEAQKKKLLEG